MTTSPITDFTSTAVTLVFLLAMAFALRLVTTAIRQAPVPNATAVLRKFVLWAVIWLVAQGALARSGFYLHFNDLPPRFLLAIGPPLVAVVYIFWHRPSRTFVNSLSLETLTWLHLCRIAVEWVLWELAQQKVVPELMTFEGRNFDILAGLSAPVMALLHFKYKLVSAKILWFWNIACLLLLLNIVGHAILSAPTPLQLLAFEQPNTAVFYFPYIYLPSVIVPLVLFSHLVAILRLRKAL